MYANITIQLVTFVSVGLKVVKNGGNIWGEEYMSVFFIERVSTPPHWARVRVRVRDRAGNGPGQGPGQCQVPGPYKSISLNT